MTAGSAYPVITGLAVGIVFIVTFSTFSVQFTQYHSVYQGLYTVQTDGGKTAITPVYLKNECQGCIALHFWDADSHVRETGKSAIKAEFLIQNITIQRGSYADVPLRLTHIGGINAESVVTVSVVPPVGYTLYWKSLAETTTEMQRFEASKTGAKLSGSVDLAQFVIGANPVTIIVGSQEIVDVRFVVPDNLSDEVDVTFVPISLEVSPSVEEMSFQNGVTGIELIIVT